MEPDIECEEEIVFDSTRLTLKVAEGILLDMGLLDFYYQQVFTGEPTHVELTDYDVVISVTKRKSEAEKTRIVTNIVMAIRAYIAKDKSTGDETHDRMLRSGNDACRRVASL